MKNFVRCFISIEFPPEAVEEIVRIQKEVSKISFKGKLTEKENLHLTLKFLGEIDRDKEIEVKKALHKISFKEMNLKLGGVGTFSRRGKPSIIWVDIYGEPIYELQKKIDLAMENAGFTKEKRFMSHLTIARVKSTKNNKTFLKEIKNIKIKEIKFETNEFKLKESKLNKTGPIYADIESYPSNPITS